MKRTICLLAFLAFEIVSTRGAFGALTIPSDGSDGALFTGGDRTINLAEAVTGNWDQDNTANAGKGVYDPNKWAVVFKYSSVNIPQNTVTFANHPSHAPVVWLVQGDVYIGDRSNLILDGESGALADQRAAGGPGGFRGGSGAISNEGRSGGFGPGGAPDEAGQYGPGQSRSYGNIFLLPLIGGSGGSGRNDNNWSGCGGGGAILIAASGKITIGGTISARSGGGGLGDPGSAGAVRLVADQILGSGRIYANSTILSGLTGGDGRVLLQANVVSSTLSVFPIPTTVPPDPLVLWPPATTAAVRVVSVSNQAVPKDPRAGLEDNTPPDLVSFRTDPVTIILETTNFPTDGVVNVFIKPRHGAGSTLRASLVGGTADLATWQVQEQLPLGYCAIQARAFVP